VAKRDDQDRSTVDPKRDDSSSVSGASAGTPPTLPPFSGDGPQPLTLHGVPAAALLGGGDGFDDLFDVPKLGVQTKSGPKPKAPGPPPLPPLVGRKGAPRPPTTGPLPVIPPIGENNSQAGSQSGSQGGSQRESSDAAPRRSEPTPGPQAINTALPSASSLIERIRAAKRNADVNEQADDKGAPEPKPVPKPMPKLAPKLAPKPMPKPAAKLPAIAPPSEQPEPAAAPESKPAPTPSEDLEVQPAVAVAVPDPIESSSDETSNQVETTPIELVEAEATEQHQAPQTATDPALGDTISAAGNDEPSQPVADTPTSMGGPARSPSGSASGSALGAPPPSGLPRPEPGPSRGGPVIKALPRPEPGPSRGGPSVSETEQTIAITKQAARLESPALPVSGSGPKLAPPPPQTSSGVHDEQPQIGVPYEPPAVIIRSETNDEGGDLDPQHASEVSPEEPRGLPRPGRLPPPSGRGPSGARPPAPPSPIAAEPQDPNALPALAPAPAVVAAFVPGVPDVVEPQDTAALIDGLANEIIAEATAESAATIHMKAPVVAVEEDPPPGQTQRNRKIALYALVGAAVISLIVTLLPSKKDDAAAKDPAVEQPARGDEKVPEAEPEPELAQADSADSAGSAGPVEAEPDPPPVGDPQPTPTDEPEAEPESKPKPVASTTSKPAPEPKPKPTPKPKPKPTPKPEPKPAPAGSTDTRNDQQLYDAAKAAYNSGSAAEAYKLASASYKKKPKAKTAELMTLAACKLKDKNKALTALNKVALLRRTPIKKECKAMGLAL
jgi:hypothetical protein